MGEIDELEKEQLNTNRIKMQSPISGGNQISLVRSIPAKDIIHKYFDSYGIDVSRLLGNRRQVDVYQCAESGFRFFGPQEVAGDSQFYASLQEYPWYYMEHKWEHDVVLEGLDQNSKLLEIGCAEGAFIKRLTADVHAVGLELNEVAAKNGQAAGLDIRTETIQDHANAHEGEYDLVCSFQVMEHVTQVREIIQSSVQALRPGGRLIISVPNNDSFIKHSPDSILNMPPHHMCLWDETSLGNLPDFFDIELIGFKFEPLQSYHFPVVVNNFVERWIGSGIIGKVVKKLIKWTRVYKVVGLFRKSIKGHSIIASYKKK